MDEHSSPDYVFEGFRLDTARQVLVSPTGEQLRLPSRAFATLRFLVERAGEVVDKSTIMSTVWPRTIVAENNLNQCILAVRKTLGETAGERRFILTVPGRGYKFVAPVAVVPRGHSGGAPPAGPPVLVAAGRSPGLWRVAVAGATLVMLVGVALLWAGRRQAVTNPAEYVRLTDVTDSATAPVLSPDGRLLAFIRNGSEFMGNGQIWVKVLPHGEPVKLTDGHGPIWAPAFTPDSAAVVYTSIDLQHGTWDTWTVPVSGGASATKLLPNAQGLTYTGPREVLYSEFDAGLHLGVVTSRDDRSLHREIYLPSHQRGMAHFSALSPDRKSVLVVEMGATGWFERCRLAPFDGKAPGYAVGPPFGACLSVAWSPDGKWMYFANDLDGSSHLWRQRFPHGAPEQITFGPSEERTVFAMPDGRSLLTSIGTTQSRLWFHTATSERALTTEGRVFAPWLSADAHRVYFLAERAESLELPLTRMQIDTGRQETLVPRFNVMEFDVSPDEQQVAFTTMRDGVHEIWLAALDRHKPPTLLVRGADEPHFGGDYVFFRRVGEHASYLHRIKTDGSGESRLLPDQIVEIFAAAPDGKALVVSRPSADDLIDAWLVPIDSAGPARILNKAYSPSQWSRDGKMLYVGLNVQEHLASSGSTIALPTGADDLPLSPLPAAQSGGTLIPRPGDAVSVGPDPSVFVYLVTEQRQNIYRIPLH